MKHVIYTLTYLIVVGLIPLSNKIIGQQIEVQGELKITQMNTNNNAGELVIRNIDGSLGTRAVATLPPPAPPIDTTRNLASDYELAKHLCDCPSLPPFMIKKLLNSGYSDDDLLDAGIEYMALKKAKFTCGDTLIDVRDDQKYATIRIGGQCWMAENINIGATLLVNNTPTDNLIFEKYCYDDNSANCDLYGGLYRWNELMQYTIAESTQGICPTGWHIPSDDEFKTLEIHLGMTQDQADAINSRGEKQGSKLAGNEPLWIDDVLDRYGTGDYPFGITGFESLPAGILNHTGLYLDVSFKTEFYTSSNLGGDPWIRGLAHSTYRIYRKVLTVDRALSVRCIRD